MFPSYNEVLSSVSHEMEDLDHERLSIVSFIKMHGALLLLGIALIILFMQIEAALAIILLGASVIYLIIVIILFYKKYQKHRLNFKEKVVWAMSREMLRLCEMPGETEAYRYDCKYNHELRIESDYIRSSRLFNFTIDKIRGEDLFSGILGLTEFKFSEITLIQVQTQTNSKGHTTRTDVTMFDGILFVADFHKEFEGVTLLKSANLFNTGTVGGWLAPLRNMFSVFSSEKKQSIDLENEDFNRAFDVQTTDEIKARYILSSSMMERLLKFKSKHREKIEVSFVHSRMYVALSSGRNYFEPKLFESIANTQAEMIYYDLIFFFGMVEDFDLNTRIWSKE
jgi:prepilin signal peptidase PulO-like enzyme (type II secretory pathway)